MLLRSLGELPYFVYDGENDFHTFSNYFSDCPDDAMLDFLEAMFYVDIYILDNKAAEKVNDIFREEGVGYELTLIRDVVTDSEWGRSVEHEHPQIIKKDEEFLHNEVVKPCLNALAHSEFKVALDEMMKAHEEIRHGQYEGALTNAAASFESVLKTICSLKGWEFDPEKATCSTLVKICKDNHLFHGFYAPMLEAVGTVRNKMSDAHGRGPEPLHEVNKEYADHMIQITSAHITMLIKLAGI
ncbi:DUF7014 domain-containing protein [Singulisphaera rosea]